MQMNSIVGFLTGEIGSGKTTVCRRIVELARGQGWRPAGMITDPVIDEHGRKVALLAEDLWTGERRRLATVEPVAGAIAAAPEESHRAEALRRGPHIFDPAVFAWTIEQVQRALDRQPALVIIDEIGPIELELGAGFAPLLAPVANGAVPALLVVRQSLRQALAQRLGQPPVVFWVTESTRERLPQDILATFLGRRLNCCAPA